MNGQLGFFDDDDGEARKEAGMGWALHGAPSWHENAKVWVRGLHTGELFTSEDLLAAIGLPSGATGQHRNNAVGASMNALARAGLMRQVGIVKSRRPISHAARIALWARTGQGNQHDGTC